MDTTETAEPSAPERKYLTVRQAAFIGVGAMVGAGIFALLGAAGEVALDYGWKRGHTGTPSQIQVGGVGR